MDGICYIEQCDNEVRRIRAGMCVGDADRYI